MRSNRGTGEVCPREGDGDRRAGRARSRRQARDGLGSNSACGSGHCEGISDGVVLVRCDIPLPVDDLGQPPQIVVDVLRLIGGRRYRHQHTEQQYRDQDRQHA